MVARHCSDDHGQTWHLGGGLVGDPAGGPSPNDRSNEATLIGGRLDLHEQPYQYRQRPFAALGESRWRPDLSDMVLEDDLQSFQVRLLRLNDNVLLFSSPRSVYDQRPNPAQMTIWLSYDDGET